MLYFHVTPTRRVQSICKHGLFALHYGAHPVLVGDAISEKNLHRHLNFYRRGPCREKGLCSVVVLDVPDRQGENYIVDPRQMGRRIPTPNGQFRHYRGIRQAIPRRFVRGFSPLEDATSRIFSGEFVKPCPKRPHTPRQYIVRGKLARLPKLAGFG